MTHWGYALLIAFVVLGLSPVSWRKAGRLAMLATVAIVAYALQSYGGL